MTFPHHRGRIAASSLGRRRFLAGASAGAIGLGLSRMAFAEAKRFDGQSLNLMIIQPHVVTGRILAEKWEALTGGKINVTAVPYDQVQAKATLDVQSGTNNFDVLDYWYTTIGALADDGVVVDLTELIERDRAEIQPDDYLRSLYDPYTLADGKRWGLPYDGDSHLLFYNKEIFDRHGLTPPTTWDEYLARAAAITEAEKANGIYGAAVLGGKAPIIIGSTYANRLAGFGGRFLKDDGTSALDETAAVQAAQALKAAAPAALPTPLETRFEEGLPAFLAGKVAMIEFWSDLGVYAQDPKGSKIVDKWDAVRIPVGGANTTPRLALNAGFGFAISSGSEKQEHAWEFIKFATSAKTSLDLLQTTGSGIDPDRTSTLAAPEYKAFAPKVQAALAGALENGLPWPTSPASPQLMQVLSDELALILAGQKSPEDAIATAHQQWTAIIGS